MLIEVPSNHPAFDYIAVGLSVWVRLKQHFACSLLGDFKGAYFDVPHKGYAEILFKALGGREIGADRKIGIDVSHRSAVKDALRFGAIVESDYGRVYRCAVEDPWLI